MRKKKIPSISGQNYNHFSSLGGIRIFHEFRELDS
jgi:hypothetical protein